MPTGDHEDQPNSVRDQPGSMLDPQLGVIDQKVEFPAGWEIVKIFQNHFGGVVYQLP
jgi:hypothetical protein